MAGSSSSSSSSSMGGRDLALNSHLDGESTIYPICTCGIPSTLMISWSPTNPGRRYYKCNRCGFFMWLDPLSRWYNYAMHALLVNKLTLQRQVRALQMEVQLMGERNGQLQELLDDYFAKDLDQGAELQIKLSELSEMKTKLGQYKKLSIVLVLVCIILYIF